VLVRRAIENVLETRTNTRPRGCRSASPWRRRLEPGAAVVPHPDRRPRLRICPTTCRGSSRRSSRRSQPHARHRWRRAGAALAKRVVEAHGGRIGITSQLDAGTTVTFLLPSADGRAREPAS